MLLAVIFSEDDALSSSDTWAARKDVLIRTPYAQSFQ